MSSFGNNWWDWDLGVQLGFERGITTVRTSISLDIAPMFMSSTFSWICIPKWSFSHGCVRGSKSVEASPNANPLQPYKVTSGSQTWQWDILINISILCFCFWRSSVVAAFSEYSIVRRLLEGVSWRPVGWAVTSICACTHICYHAIWKVDLHLYTPCGKEGKASRRSWVAKPKQDACEK